ncbi:X-Pro aminopeptidase [Euryarchaeota archaeon ex4484_178]|nr:MAG: X-Pro aminopeptidase [Euryarchaeota archaeon ex4484_178]
MNFQERIKNLQKKMEERWDAAILTPGTNFSYLSGLNPAATLERPFLLVIPSAGKPKILAPMLYKLELKNVWIEEIYFWEDVENPYQKLANIFQDIPIKKNNILVEDTMPASFLINIGKLFNFKFDLLGEIISEFRIKKSAEELSNLQRAAEIVDKVFYELLAEGLEGRPEREVANKIVDLIYKNGGDGISFEPIVASGSNGANPHHMPGERMIERGDVVILDYGAKYQGYCSDITRTVVVGKATEEIRKVYNIVKKAQDSAFNKSKKGVMAKEIDMAARNVISSYGYGQYFTHRTGHGLGLDVHEPPFITSVNNRIIDDGMVFTIEPGIYLPGKFGIRIEDDVAIIGGKGVRLTKAERELLEVR